MCCHVRHGAVGDPLALSGPWFSKPTIRHGVQGYVFSRGLRARHAPDEHK